MKEFEATTASMLAKNTLVPALKETLLNYESDKDMIKVIELIANSDYDISHFGLWEIPYWGVYCFFNIENNDQFDVYLDDFNGNGRDCTFGYVDGNFCTQDAESIIEAISKYSG